MVAGILPAVMGGITDWWQVFLLLFWGELLTGGRYSSCCYEGVTDGQVVLLLLWGELLSGGLEKVNKMKGCCSTE